MGRLKANMPVRIGAAATTERRGYKLACVILCLLLLTLSHGRASGQQLRRRGSLGAGIEPQGSRLLIKSVSPGGTAEAAGLMAGDVLLRVGDVEITGVEPLGEALRRYRAGDSATLLIERGGKQIEKGAVFKPRPLETSPDFDVLYDAVDAGGAKYRTIVTRPKGAGPFPAVLLIGGLGCYSLDNLQPTHPYHFILYNLTRKGSVTMRVEKSGEGDSEGPPCKSPEADLQLAAARNAAGLRALKGYDFVNPGQVFIFAHSIGPLEGALVVNEVPVAGMIAAETIGRDWFTYQGEIAYAQPLMLGKGYDETEAQARALALCNARFYLQKQTPETLAREAPGCLEKLPISAVSYRYLQQVADLKLAEQWKKPDVPVLVIYGTSDPTTDEGEGRYLVDMINSFHPGRATYLQVEGMNHYFDREASKKDGLLVLQGKKEAGDFEPAVLTGVENWLEKLVHR
jgi:pimeloyl-ACP methyl ester carboxylesterase